MAFRERPYQLRQRLSDALMTTFQLCRDFYLVQLIGYPNQAVDAARVHRLSNLRAYLATLQPELVREGYYELNVAFKNVIAQLLKLEEADLALFKWINKVPAEPFSLSRKLRRELEAFTNVFSAPVIHPANPPWSEHHHFRTWSQDIKSTMALLLSDIETAIDLLSAFQDGQDEEPSLLNDERDLRQQMQFLRISIRGGLQELLAELSKTSTHRIKEKLSRPHEPEELINDLVDEASGEARPDRALHKLTRALRLAKSSRLRFKVLYSLALTYEEVSNDARALECYTLALDLERHSALALLRRGVLHHRQGRYPEAQDDLTNALASPTAEAELRPDQKVEAQAYISAIRSNRSLE